MRTFLFKVWDNKYPGWMMADFGKISGNQTFIAAGGSGYNIGEIFQNETMGEKIHEEKPFNGTNPRWIICQFTGLQDKNNNAIYEGDVVKTDPRHSSVMSVDWAEYTAGVIKWLCEGFKICQRYVGAQWLDTYSTCDCCPCGLEIIGNIYENPELKNIDGPRAEGIKEAFQEFKTC